MWGYYSGRDGIRSIFCAILYINVNSLLLGLRSESFYVKTRTLNLAATNDSAYAFAIPSFSLIAYLNL